MGINISTPLACILLSTHMISSIEVEFLMLSSGSMIPGVLVAQLFLEGSRNNLFGWGCPLYCHQPCLSSWTSSWSAWSHDSTLCSELTGSRSPPSTSLPDRELYCAFLRLLWRHMTWFPMCSNGRQKASWCL